MSDTDFQIVIPMTGLGKRFQDAGYKDPKPLIKVDGRPMIEYVINLFPGEKDFIFIINEDHKESTNIVQLLESLVPTCQIVSAPKGKGPVDAVLQAEHLIDDERPVIVNYCDFNMKWDYPRFKQEMIDGQYDGGIPCYLGFHPHLLHKQNLYASCRVDENLILQEIREKHSFTPNTMDSYQSVGTYYHGSGANLKTYYHKLVESENMLNGEYYSSMVYEGLLADNLRVKVFEVEQFCQWGTPNDLEEYLYWSTLFRAKIHNQDRYDAPTAHELQMIVPIGGKGLRFKKEGYDTLKPLIKVGETPMFVQTLHDLPIANSITFVCSNEHINELGIDQEFKEYFPEAKIVALDPEGPLEDCLHSESHFDLELPLLLAPCDNGLIWSMSRLLDELADPKVDALAWTFRNHMSQKVSPQSWGWIDIDYKTGVIKSVSCKVPISDNPIRDHAIVGTFYFRKAKYFFEAARDTLDAGHNVGGVAHVDLCINALVAKGYCAKVFEVDKYIGRGTPNDYRTYQYWQAYHEYNPFHPYQRSLDEDYTLA